MNDWPTMWRHNTLSVAKLPLSDHNVRIMSLWRRSTPTEPWTLNPIGIPKSGYSHASALNTPYAAFHSWSAFYDAFAKALDTGPGRELRMALSGSESLPEIWRAIASLDWPGSKTETDYPSAILDAMDSDFREKLGKANGDRRSTTGRTHVPPNAGGQAASAARSAMTGLPTPLKTAIVTHSTLRGMN